MNYVANNYLLKKRIASKKAGAFYTLYQHLGLLWEFLGCQCKHWEGYKKKGNKFLCKICGKVKGTKESYYLLPVRGGKNIGRFIRPGKDKSGKLSKKEAEIVNDTIKFHGAKLNVSVFNGYTTKLDKIGGEINIAADRIVSLEEDRLIIEISKYIVNVKIRNTEKHIPTGSGFSWELPKRILRKIPLILSCDKHGKLTQIELIR